MQAQTPEVSAEKATTPAEHRLVSVEQLKKIHRDLDACQKVIWLAGCRPRGYCFDPSYVTDAQERLKEIEELLEELAPAQDEREVAAVIGFYEGEREPRLLSWNVLPNGEHRLYTRPAQTTPQPEQSGWISVTDRLPEPGRSHGAGVLCWREGWLQPREMKLVSNAYAKTEKGRRPRWEETKGCLAFSEPTHWMPMPAGPAQSAQGVTHGR